MPATFKYPPFDSQAKAQGYRSWFIIFVKPDPPGSLQQLKRVKGRRDQKCVVCENKTFNTFQFTCAKLSWWVRIPDCIGSEAKHRRFKEVGSKPLAKSFFCSERLIDHINNPYFCPGLPKDLQLLLIRGGRWRQLRTKCLRRFMNMFSEWL